MSSALFQVPAPANEPIKEYAPGSPERKELQYAINELRSKATDVPMFIGGEEIKTENKVKIAPPHELQHHLGHYFMGDKSHVKKAIEAALAAKKAWAGLHWEHRASIFLKAAELLSGPFRAKINAATMLGQSKNVHEAEIDSACELIDFLRFNVYFMGEIYGEQPNNSPGVWNRNEYRPLEGFVFAVTPFNFTSISGNLPSSAAMMGNTVVWKPSRTQLFAARVIMEVFQKAGLPPGVINMVIASGSDASEVVLNHPDFAGFHFTGSVPVLKKIWKTIGENLDIYKSFPRIVGETGGKDFVVAHSSADVRQLVTALSRGAFEYQGQKCSAASRAYIPSNLWENAKKLLLDDIGSFKMGGVEDFGNFINAVIDENAFEKIAGYIDAARNSDKAEIIVGGNYDKSKGYFIEPTVILAKEPGYVTMREEIFGPVLTVYVYDADDYEEILKTADKTSPYGLTGSIFGQDRYALELGARILENAAGNFYINDKPTGAVVGQQPFAGARKSGTNDKAGSKLNLYRWVSMRTIKENFNPPENYRYPFLEKDK